MYEQTFPIWKPSPNRAAIGFSQIAFHMIVLPVDDRTDFRSRGMTGSSVLDHDSGHLGNFKDVQFYPIFIFGHFWAALLKMSGFTPPEILAIFGLPPWSPF